jgi:competence protein ComEA
MADGSRRRGIVLGAIAAVVITVIYVMLRQRNVPDLIVQSDEGWQPDVRATIGGEVVNPGTYTARGDARLSDLVASAGGYTERADRLVLNPAARISDGMEYIIPTIPPRAATTTATVRPSTPPPPATATSGAGPSPGPVTPQPRPAPTATAVAGRVNINTATKEELEALPAIGAAIAQRIIDDRTANGPYKQVEDLARVRGISARTVDQLRDRITVGP